MCDVSLKILNEFKGTMDEVVFNRAQFVIQEHERVLNSVKKIKESKFKEFGMLMYESHYGLKELYQVSCQHLDFMVDISKNYEHVLGSRMMGGGFGGCTINLIHSDFIDSYIDAGADIITIHEESGDDISKCIEHIKSKGIKAAISVNPPTELKKILKYLDKVDMVLIMSVNPGYAGQKFIPEVLEKIRELRRLKPNLDIQIDGGICKETIKQAADAGANIFVVGSAIFGEEDRKKAIDDLRQAMK